MNLKTSRTILKVAGILALIGAAFSLITGIIMVVGGGAALASNELAGLPNAKVAIIVTAVSLFIAVVLSVIEGIVSLKASSNNKYGTAALVFGILGVLGTIYNIVSTIKGGDLSASNIVSLVIAIVVNILVCVAASRVRTAYKNGEE